MDIHKDMKYDFDTILSRFNSEKSTKMVEAMNKAFIDGNNILFIEYLHSLNYNLDDYLLMLRIQSEVNYLHDNDNGEK